MPMKCVVCGQLTDAEFRYERSQAEVAMVRSVLEAKRLFLDDAVARRDAAEARAAAAESALAEAKFSLEHECEIYNAACAELAVKDAALAEARGALRLAQKALRCETCDPDNPGQMEVVVHVEAPDGREVYGLEPCAECDAYPDRVAARSAIATLARAGEQETPQPPPEVMAGIEEMERHPPLSVGCGNPATFRAGEPASSGQEVVMVPALAVDDAADARMADLRSRQPPEAKRPITPPAGEQGNGGVEWTPCSACGSPRGAHQRWCAALARAGEHGRGSSTDRAPGRNPGDAGSSPAPSTPDEQEK